GLASKDVPVRLVNIRFDASRRGQPRRLQNTYRFACLASALQNASLKAWSMKYFRRGLHEYRNENGAGADPVAGR
ncbi:hypothetical protein HUSEC_26661, partial [Escherichia coli O104:H4 str. LB226692]